MRQDTGLGLYAPMEVVNFQDLYMNQHCKEKGLSIRQLLHIPLLTMEDLKTYTVQLWDVCRQCGHMLNFPQTYGVNMQ